MNMRGPLDFLVVEDRTVEAIDLETKLEDMGHTVVGVASHVQRALQRIEETRTQIDGVFLNPALAGRSSRPVAEQLFRLGVPYVLVTELTPFELRRLGFRGPRLPDDPTPAAIKSALREITARVPPRFVQGCCVGSV